MTIIGSRIGRIRVESLLGRGGMGEVYVGYDETLHRQVALKSIRASHRLSEEVKARFVREARLLSQLDNPNICRIYDFISGRDRDFLVLELVRGRDLMAAIGTGLGWLEKLDIASKIADALVAAHSEGVVHRDLKPDNVMLTDSGEVKVLDFGLAAAGHAEPSAASSPDLATTSDDAPQEPSEVAVSDRDQTLAIPGSDRTLTLASTSESVSAAGEVKTVLGTVMGTPSYMSPEQARGGQVTTASDMYSFGLLLQTLFTGRSPHPAESSQEEVLRRAVASDTRPVVGLDADMTRLIESLKSSAPAKRPTALATLERLRWISDKPKRRLRRLIGAAVLTVIALGGAKYTFDLKVARDEANLRREQAEDLIGFMIGDLRGKLAPVNRLEVLDDIGDKALEYFAGVPAVELSDDELRFRSQTLSQIGQVRMDQGDLPAAMQAFEESRDLAASLVGRDPDNSSWRAELGAAHFWVGSVFWMRRDLDRALVSFGQYLDESEELVAREPDNLEWQLELSYAQGNIGSVLEAQGRIAEAIQTFQTSLEATQRLVAAQPENTEWRAELASGHSWLAEALLSQGDLGLALHHYESNRDILRSLVEENPAHRRWKWLLGIAHQKVGLVLEIQGQQAAASVEYNEYLERNRSLVLEDADNSTWRRELAVAHRRGGYLALWRGELEEAVSNLRTAREILEQLIDLDSTNADWAQELARSRILLAWALSEQGRPGEALEAAQDSLAICDALLMGSPDEPEARSLCSEIFLVRGNVEARDDRFETAREWWQRAVDTIESIAEETGHPRHQELRVRSLLRLDRLDEARPIAGELLAQGFRRQAFIAVCEAKGICEQQESPSAPVVGMRTTNR